MRHLILLAALAAIPACVSFPKNVAMGSSNNVFGKTYEGQLIRILPIFVQNQQGSAYRETSGQAAGLIAEVIGANSQYVYQAVALANAAGSAVSGEYEQKYRGAFCQYYLMVNDPDLMTAISGGYDEDDYAEEEDEYRDREDRYETDYFEENLESLEEQTEDARILADIQRQQADIDSIRARLDRPDAPTEPEMIMIVNPCRDFNIGQDLIIAFAGYEAILEPSWKPD
ncbi:hypothetical protein L0664_14700 [Octadecabacter sp. G9-8]|uniref:Uncharacterized protein n=1 Tax=Octadecabacter dasysiphoniae TaxID=2909341 RepID=A0ABS9CZI2_9RHOB|nr:hypothetical protein [Octadecabacter dasysiphoniae]MCF2872321.1 hypothetical protein [Octadecabacter dasysiphoniae]